MIRALEIKDFLQKVRELPALDVRSPGEYLKGHIPKVQSFPLFSDEERANVGTTYKQISPKDAVLMGLGILGPKMEPLVRQAMDLAPDGKICVHCWRGGMRSGSVAWLLNTVGFSEVYTLIGGYKSYRKFAASLFTEKLDLWVLGGMTGSGKTEILNRMKDRGHQVIDLEKWANHKGSAFGAIGESAQPTTEHFENLIAWEMKDFDLSKPVWIEDESYLVGNVIVPEGLILQIKASKVIKLDVSKEIRAQRLAKDYAFAKKEEVETALTKISRKLGGQRFQLAMEALEKSDAAELARIILDYYDKFYSTGLSKRVPETVFPLEIKEDNPELAAELIENLYLKICRKPQLPNFA